jgi:hypothetical protein
MSEEQSNFENEEIENLSTEEQVDLRDQLKEQVDQIEEQVEDVKEKAKSTGHLSAEAYQAKHGSLKGYKSEEEFVRTGEMIEQIYSLKKKLDERDKEISAIVNYTNNTIKEHKEKARQEIESRLNQAREYGNIQAIEALTRQKSQMEFQEQQELLKEGLNKQQVAFNQFVDRNKHWFNDAHPELKQEAIALDADIINRYKAAGMPMPSYDELMFQIENHMKNKYPDLVNTGIKTRPSLTPSRSSVTRSMGEVVGESDDKVFTKLSSDQKYMYQANKRIMAKAGLEYTVKEFVQKLKADGDI